MRNFFRILAYGKPYRHFAALNAVFNLLGTLFHLASLLLFIPFLRLLLGQVQMVHERPTALWTREGLEGTFNWGLTVLIEDGLDFGLFRQGVEDKDDADEGLLQAHGRVLMAAVGTGTALVMMVAVIFLTA